MGAAYGTAKAGIGISTMGVLRPDAIMKSIVPIVMAGILGIYGLIIAVILIQKSIFYYLYPHPSLVAEFSDYTDNGQISYGPQLGY